MAKKTVREDSWKRKYPPIKIGDRFGKLTAASDEYRKGKQGVFYVDCQCECGNKTCAPRYRLASGKQTRCRKCPNEARKDLTGQRFGRLVCIKHLRPEPQGGSWWECKCDCKTVIEARSHALLVGKKNSCGCLYRESRGRAGLKHGMTGKKAFASWRAMIRRCTNPLDKKYPSYGGRGIAPCSRWKDGEDGKSGLQCFVEDMGEPEDGMTLERIDNNSGYSKGNCKWASRKEQSRNRRNTLVFDWKGKKLSLPDICDLEKVPYINVLSRLSLGWDLDRAVTQPVKSTKKKAV